MIEDRRDNTIMKINALDISVTLFAGLACLLYFIHPDAPVWALFIGWAWYFALGSKPENVKKSILPIAIGASLAVIAFIMINVLNGMGMNGTISIAISVMVTVFILMMTLKIERCAISLISFNAYSCIFVAFSYGAYPIFETLPGYLNVVLTVSGFSFIGVLVGWMSVAVTSLGNKKA